MPVYLYSRDAKFDSEGVIDPAFGSITSIDLGDTEALSIAAPDGGRVLADISGELLPLGYTLVSTHPNDLAGRRDWGKFTTANEPVVRVSETVDSIADAAVGATAITGVTDNGGKARFAFTGPTLFAGQTVVISGFTTNPDYNTLAGGETITDTDGTTYFEVGSIDFGSDETGSFTSPTVTVTATGHTIADGEVGLIAVGDIAYDGDQVVYNVLTNTFQINATFGSTQSGTVAHGTAEEGDVGYDTTRAAAVVFTGGAWVTYTTLNANQILVFGDGSTQEVGAVRESLSWHPESSQLRGLFSITVQDDLPKGIYLRADGLKLYMIGWESDDVNEYDLTTPWDLSSRSLLQTFSVAGKDNQPYTVVFKPDGTEFYISGNQSKDFHQYTLSTPWDVTSAVFTATSNPASVGHFQIAFRYDGKRIYSVGNSTTVRSYDLSTAWDLTSQSTGPSFVVSETLRGIAFSPDGRSMFGCTSTELVEYDLTVPWDHTTAVLRSSTVSGESNLQCLIAKVDGEAFYSVQTGDDNIVEFSLGSVATGKTVAKGTLVIEGSASFEENAGAIQYRDGSTQEHGTVPTNIAWQIDSATELQSFSLALQEPSGLYIRPDGLKMYITDTNGNNVSEFDLGTPWDVSTAVLLQASGLGATPEDIFFKPDGLRFWEVDGQFDRYTQYDLSTAWDISTKSETADIGIGSTGNDPRSSFWKPTGDAFYILNAANDTVFQLDTPIPWDVSTAPGTSSSFSVTNEETAPTGLFFRSDGCAMYITGATDLIHQYVLDTPWNLDSCRFVKSFDISGTNKQATGIFFKPDGSKAYYTNSDGSNDAVYELDIGISVVGKVIAGSAFIDERGSLKEVRTHPPEVVLVYSSEDLEELATANVITVSGLLTVVVYGIVTTPVRFVGAGGSLRIVTDAADDGFVYTGTDPYFSGDWTRISMENVLLIAGSTGPMLGASSTVSSSFNVLNCAIIGWSSLGTMIGGRFLLRFSLVLSCDEGITVLSPPGPVGNPPLITVLNSGFTDTPASGNLPAINTGGSGVAFAVELILVSVFNPPAGISLLRVDPGLHEDSQLQLSNNSIPSTVPLFDTSGGTAGTFTAVADAAVASTTITSVTDSSDIARFNFTVGPTLFVGQRVTIVGYVTNTAYNITGVITAVGVGFFEVGSVVFGTGEAGGSFTSDSVTITDTTTTLSDGDTLVLDTDDATDYDGGAVVYNQLTNSFQINRAFTVTRAGTWDTAGVGRRDARVLSLFNPGFVDSKYLGGAFANGLSTATTGIVNGAFQDIAYGTGGAGLVVFTTLQRFKMLDEVNGTFEYAGNEPFCGEISTNSVVISTGGNQDFRTKWVVDKAPGYTGFVDLADNVEDFADVGTTSTKMSQQQSVDLEKGDRVKKQVTRVAGTSTITFQYESINIFQ